MSSQLARRRWFHNRNASDQPNRRRRALRPWLEPVEARTLLSGATYMVTSALDGGAGTLRAAIDAANLNAGADTIDFDADLAGKTIILGGTQLEISDDLTIDGLGADQLTVDANGQSRAFLVDSAVTAALSGLAITGGNESNSASPNFTDKIGGGILNQGMLTLTNCAVAANTAIEGGGIWNTGSGTLAVNGSTFSDNTVISALGSAVVNKNSSSVADSVFDSNPGQNVFVNDGSLSVTGSTFSNNHINGNTAGVAILCELTSSSLTVIDSHFTNNFQGIQATGSITVAGSAFSGHTASGISTSSACTATIVNSTFSGNSGSTAAIFNDGMMTITGDTITGNTSTNAGGGVINFRLGTLTVANSTIAGNSAHQAGGIYNLGTLTVANSTIAGNSAGNAGGIWNDTSGVLTVTNSTVVSNVASFAGGIWQGSTGAATLNNTIVAGNVLKSGGPSDIEGTPAGSDNLIGDPATAGGFANGVNANLVGDGSGGPLDLATVFVDANNDETIDSTDLADNGGPTHTLALKPDSPAVDAADNALAVDAGGNPLTSDQRGPGFDRIVSGTVDIGAYELAVDPLVVTNTNDSGPGSLRATIQYANTQAGPQTISFNIPITDPNFVDDDAGLSGGDAAPDIYRIQLATSLPTVAGDDTTIDGLTQTAFSGDTNPFGPEIELVGLGSTTGVGLDLGGSRDAVRGLAIDDFDAAVRLGGGGHHTLSGNNLGVDPTGTKAQTHQSFGVVGFSSNNTVGGTTAADRNLIAGSSYGIWIVLQTANVVEGNYIGINAAGTSRLGGSGYGALLQDAPGNTIADNVISGNNQAGVWLVNPGTSGNVVQGNSIGTNAAGAAALPNSGQGILVSRGAHGNVIGTDADGVNDAAERNVISGNAGDGVLIADSGTSGNVVAGNFIGTDASSTTAVPNNGNGVVVAGGAQDNVIGTNGDGVGDDAEGNLISGNLSNGVEVSDSGTTGNVLAGNFIGTDASGTAALPNGSAGVLIQNGATNNLVGGSTAVARNIISGNRSNGVSLNNAATSNNIVAGNYIGTDATGLMALANGGNGIFVGGSASNDVIGTNGDGQGDAAEGNLISGNASNGILIVGASTNDVVAGNLVGTDATGTRALANGGLGVYLYLGPTGNRIGTNSDGLSDAAERNVIAGNASEGVGLGATNDNVIAGNYVGTDITGTKALGNSGFGVVINNGAASNTVGGPSAAARNVISGNADGLRIGEFGVNANNSGTFNVIEGNYIGTDVTGTVAVANSWWGVLIQGGGQNNRVGTDGDGTADAAERNVIAGNKGPGIQITGAFTANNVAAGNFIGTTADGTAALANGAGGVVINAGARDNVIGTNGDGVGDAAEGNVISGNLSNGVSVSDSGTSGNIVAGNYIGTTADGTAALGNGGNGVYLSSPSNTVGGPLAVQRNIISANANDGIHIEGAGATGNRVQGNSIGTDASGTKRLGNQGRGVWARAGAHDNIIGTDGDGQDDATEGNLIATNGLVGVLLGGAGTTGNVVAGNLIGTDRTATVGLGNGGDGGVRMTGGAQSNRIGTNGDGISDSSERNVIASSLWGIVIDGSGTDGNVVAGNFIGTNPAGAADMGNGPSGVLIEDGAQGNTIGGAAAVGNTIAFNAGAGVAVTDAGTTGNAIVGNAIFSNSGLGIDLNNDGVTPNDPGDADTGPNDLQNAPVIESATTNSSGTRIAVSLQSTPNTTFHVELFVSPAADPSGSGEGAQLLAVLSLPTDASGNASYVYTPPSPIGVGQVVTATATDPGGNTSEFSAAAPVAHVPDDVTAQVSFRFGGFYLNRRNFHLAQSVTITNTSASTIAGPISLVLDGLTPGVTLANATGTTRDGNAYIDVVADGGSLAPGQSITILLDFSDPRFTAIAYTPIVLAGKGLR